MKEHKVMPIAEAAQALGITRERLLRRIQTRKIKGGKELGYWYVERASIERELAEVREIMQPIADNMQRVAQRELTILRLREALERAHDFFWTFAFHVVDCPRRGSDDEEKGCTCEYYDACNAITKDSTDLELFEDEEG